MGTKHRKVGMSFLLQRMGVGVLIVLALVAGLMSVTASRAAAASSGSSRDDLSWGYVWAGQPTTASYTPDYQFNSSYGSANTITRTGTGAYTVSFPNLGLPAGTVHVTAYGSGTETCKVGSWGPIGSTQQVYVRCFNISGLPVDTYYTVVYTGPLGATIPISTLEPMAFVWANQPGSASYTPASNYQFNSTGASVMNTITRTGTGAYTVWLPGLGAAYGHVQVTAYGYGSERCKVAGWGPSGTTQLVNVRCFNISGAPVDTYYTMTYVRNTSIVGGFGHGAYTIGAYAWADQPGSASYTPSLSYQYDFYGTTNTITRLGTGSYAVSFSSQDLNEGDVQVTAYGAGSEFCKVAYWDPWDGVHVNCFDSTGTPKDTYYDVTFLSSYLLG